MRRLLVCCFALSLAGCSADNKPIPPATKTDPAPAGKTAPVNKAGGKAALPPME